MADRVAVLYARPWSMVDEKTGAKNEGIKCEFVNEYAAPSDGGELGLNPSNTSLPPQVYETFQKHGLPGLYDFDYASRPGPGGKAVVVVTGAKYVGPIDLFRTASAGAAAAAAK